MPCHQLRDNIVMSTMEGELADITVAETSRHAEGAPTCPSQVAEANTELASVSPIVEAPASKVSASSTSTLATSMEPATAASEQEAKSGLAGSSELTSAVSQSETSRTSGSKQALAGYPESEPPEASQSSRQGWGIQDPVPNIDSLNDQLIKFEADERNEGQDTFSWRAFSDQDTYQRPDRWATAIEEAGRVFCTDVINAQCITYSPYQVLHEQLGLKWTLLEDYWHDEGVIYEKIYDKALTLTGTKATNKIVSGIGRLDVSTFKVTGTYEGEDEEYYCDTIGTYRDRHGGAHPMQVNIAFRVTNQAMPRYSTLFYNLQVSGLQLIHTPSKRTARNCCAGGCCLCTIL